MKNLCDYGHETTEQIRKLPWGSDGNILCCAECFAREIQAQNDTTTRWIALKLYARKQPRGDK